MTVKIVHTNLDGSTYDDYIQVDGELSQPQLDNEVREWLHNNHPEWCSATINFMHPSYTLVYTTTRARLQ